MSFLNKTLWIHPEVPAIPENIVTVGDALLCAVMIIFAVGAICIMSCFMLNIRGD